MAIDPTFENFSSLPKLRCNYFSSEIQQEFEYAIFRMVINCPHIWQTQPLKQQSKLKR